VPPHSFAPIAGYTGGSDDVPTLYSREHRGDDHGCIGLDSRSAKPDSTPFRIRSCDRLRMYYEIHGTGQPLILVHGGLGSSDMFASIVPELSNGRQLIAVDLQAHGRTVDIDRPLSFEAMADENQGD
jgi:hypothetical protein